VEGGSSQRGRAHWGLFFFVMGSKDKFFPMYGCIHSHLNRVTWWTNNEVISSQRKGSTRVGIPTFAHQQQSYELLSLGVPSLRCKHDIVGDHRPPISNQANLEVFCLFFSSRSF